MVNFKLPAVLILASSALTLAERRQYKLQFYNDLSCTNSTGSAAILWRGECGEFGSIKPTSFLLEDNPKGLRCKSGYKPRLWTSSEAGCPGPKDGPTNPVKNTGECNWLVVDPMASEMPVVKSAKWDCVKVED